MKEEKQFDFEPLESIGIILFMTIYALAGIYIFPVNLIFLPIPFIYLGVKRGLSQGIISFLVVALSITIMVDIPSGILMVLLYLPVTYTIIDGIKYRRSSLEILGLTSAILFVSTLLFYGITQNITGVDIIFSMEEGFNRILTMQTEMFQEMGLSNFEILKTIEELEGTYKIFMWIFPVIILAFSILSSYLNYYISVQVLRKSGIGIISVPRFSKFRLPNNILLGITIMLVFSYIIKALQINFSDLVFLNIAALIWFMFTTQGLSVIDFYLKNYKFKPIARVITIIFFIFFRPLGTMAFLIGVVDTIIDFRKFRKSNA